MILRGCVDSHNTETLLVRHRLVLVSQIIRLKALHQLTVRFYLALFTSIELGGNPWINQWHVVLFVLHSVGPSFTSIYIVLLGQLPYNLLCKTFIILFGAE